MNREAFPIIRLEIESMKASVMAHLGMRDLLLKKTKEIEEKFGGTP